MRERVSQIDDLLADLTISIAIMAWQGLTVAFSISGWRHSIGFLKVPDEMTDSIDADARSNFLDAQKRGL